MKTLIKKISSALVTLMIMMAVAGCSSYEDPDVVFKGPVDDDFLSALARGEVSIQLTTHYYQRYYQAIDNNGKCVSKWGSYADLPTEWQQIMTGCFRLPDFKQTTISEGKTIHIEPYNDENEPSAIPEIYQVYSMWNYYVRETASDIKYGYCRPVTYNKDSHTLRIRDFDFHVESANDKKIVLSFFADNYQCIQTAAVNIKYVATFEVKPTNGLDISKTKLYDDRNDMILAMVILMRSYFGDIFDYGKYIEGNRYVENIAELEAKFRKIIDESHGVDNYFDKRYPQE